MNARQTYDGLLARAVASAKSGGGRAYLRDKNGNLDDWSPGIAWLGGNPGPIKYWQVSMYGRGSWSYTTPEEAVWEAMHRAHQIAPDRYLAPPLPRPLPQAGHQGPTGIVDIYMGMPAPGAAPVLAGVGGRVVGAGVLVLVLIGLVLWLVMRK